MKKLCTIFIAIVATMSFSLTTMAAPVEYGEELSNMPSYNPEIKFSDVSSDHWAYSYIAEMSDREIIAGYPDGKFRPNNKVTRAQLAKIMVLATGQPLKKVNYSSYSDIPVSNWASPFAETAKDYLTGFRLQDGSYVFRPNAPAVREDVAVALVKLKGYDRRFADQSLIKDMFSDFDGISENAKDYVAIAIENGIFSGKADGKFDPQGTLTRAQAAAVIWRAYQYGDDNKEVTGGTPVGLAPTPKPTTQQTPEQGSVKFTVDTLVGGIGKGDLDGPVYQAKINEIDSMVLDKNDNIYFLDSSVDKIRKFNKANGTVETFKSIDESFSEQMPAKYNDEYNLRSSLQAYKLAYDYARDKLYVMGQISYGERSYGFTKKFATLFDITGNTELTSNFTVDGNYQPKFILFPSSDNIIYGLHTGYDSQISQGKPGIELTLLASEREKTGMELPYKENQAEAILNDNILYTFNTENLTLSKMTLFPRKIETINTIQNIADIGSAVAYNNKFYYTHNATIYEMDTTGKISRFLDGTDLVYSDGNPIQKINHLSFDTQGNIILYDDKNKAIRRINL